MAFMDAPDFERANEAGYCMPDLTSSYNPIRFSQVDRSGRRRASWTATRIEPCKRNCFSESGYPSLSIGQ
jgi:hypothetical protein